MFLFLDKKQMRILSCFSLEVPCMTDASPCSPMNRGRVGKLRELLSTQLFPQSKRFFIFNLARGYMP